MWTRLTLLWRVTAIRLSIIYTIVIGLAAAGIIAYMTGGAVNLVRTQYEQSIDEEVEALARFYQRGGLNLLFRVLERRANAPGANLYAVSNPQGEIVAGNAPGLEPRVMQSTGWKRRPFTYLRYEDEVYTNDDDDDDDEDHRRRVAIGRVLEIPNGMRLLVGRDVREYKIIGNVVSDASKIAIGFMVAFGLLTWFFVGRRALKRIDRVTQSSQRILSGDRSERLPVSGTNDEFDRLSVNLNRMLDRINLLDEGVKQISDNIAHDLKTPITRLRNKAYDALHNTNSLEAQRDAMNEIISDCDQIVKTFDALMMISRVGSGATVGKLQQVDLVEILRDVHELYEAVAEEVGVTLELEINAGETVNMLGNRELLSQAVSNLLENAIKYGRSSGREQHIKLQLASMADHSEVTVSDNGPGVPANMAERVKDRFYRLDKSRNLPGNGLGLSLVEAIAQFHSGELILADNEPGLRATLKLPVRKTPAS